jgi:chemotaxis protein CheD
MSLTRQSRIAIIAEAIEIGKELCFKRCFSPMMWLSPEKAARNQMKKSIGIHIGDLHASREPAIISTLLGSCVAVCLYDPKGRIGGMNHIFLPGTDDLQQFDSPARYGINAMELLINRMMAVGGERRRLVAKVFGGANILPVLSEEYAMGPKNVEFVLEFLRIESIRVISWDLGGYQARKVIFHTDTGVVFLKRLPSAYYSNIELEERRALELARNKARGSGKVDMFE